MPLTRSGLWISFLLIAGAMASDDPSASIGTRSEVIAVHGHQAPGSAPSPVHSATGDSKTGRLVHRFDFDERGQGNLEDIPKYWVPFRPPGFPHYAHGEFDFEVGRLAAPSFHVLSEGRNVAFQYLGEETRVRTNSEYRIEGYVRADRLESARACLSAHFLDDRGNILIESFVRSPYVGGGEDDGWVPVELFLGAAPSEAYSIGLVAWVVRESAWNVAKPIRRQIPGVDVLGGAWFDDISVFRLPRVSLRSSSTANVLTDDDHELFVELADHDDPNLSGLLSIHSREEAVVSTHPIAVSLEPNADPIPIDVGHLPPGLYHARLDITAQGMPIVSHALTFARTAQRLSPPESIVRSFGIVIDPRDRASHEAELELLQHVVVRSVKVPVWSGLSDDPPTEQEAAETDLFLQTLLRRNFAISGVLYGPPGPIVRSQGAYAPALLEFLALDPSVWHDHLAAVATPYASLFRWWQLGSDDDRQTLLSSQIAQTADRLRSALRPYLTSPLLAAAVSGMDPIPTDRPVTDHLTVHFSPEVVPSIFNEKISAWRAAGYERVSSYVDPVSEDRFDTSAALADWSQRVIAARHAGADTVYVPQPWRTTSRGFGALAEPDERYHVLRTLADVIGDAPAGPRLVIAGGIECLGFQVGPASVLAIWDAKADGRKHPIPMQLGLNARAVDLFGRPISFQRDKMDRQIVEVDEQPILVYGASPDLIAIQSAFELHPAFVESGTDTTKLTLRIDRTPNGTITGTVTLVPPKSWDVWPREFALRTSRNDLQEMALEMRFPTGEVAGTKTLNARVRLADDEGFFEVPLSFEFGLNGVVVWGMAVLEGDKLVVQHGLTNKTNSVLNLRSAASVPGRERQYRSFTNVEPGETQIVKYRYPNGEPLVGRRLRLGIRELNDGRRSHNLEVVVP